MGNIMEKQTFSSLIEAVEENNSMHDVTWKAWSDADHIQHVYGELEDEYRDVATAFLNALIRDEGENIETYSQAMSALEYGKVFNN